MKIANLAQLKPKLGRVAVIIAVFGAGFYVGRSRWSADLASGSNGGQERQKTASKPNSADPNTETFIKGRPQTIKTSEKKSYFSTGWKKLPFYLINGLGRLTSEAIAQAGLTESEAQGVERIINEIRSSAEDSIASRLTLDSKKSQPDKGYYVFDARASVDRGQGMQDQLRVSLEKLLGSSRAAILAASYDIDDTPLGFDGKDLHFEVKYPSGGERKYMLVTYEVYNPETGNRSVGGQSSIEAFERRFGTIIDFAKK